MSPTLPCKHFSFSLHNMLRPDFRTCPTFHRDHISRSLYNMAYHCLARPNMSFVYPQYTAPSNHKTSYLPPQYLLPFHIYPTLHLLHVLPSMNNMSHPLFRTHHYFHTQHVTSFFHNMSHHFLTASPVLPPKHVPYSIYTVFHTPSIICPAPPNISQHPPVTCHPVPTQHVTPSLSLRLRHVRFKSIQHCTPSINQMSHPSFPTFHTIPLQHTVSHHFDTSCHTLRL